MPFPNEGSRPAEQLFALLAGGTVEAGSASADDWDVLARSARDHRLGPWLHAQCRDIERVPQTLREQWADAHRDAALSALIHERTLLRIADDLQRHGQTAIVLKGGWLAAHVYAHPALRPVRDLDLLLPNGEEVAVWERLQADGYALAERLELPPKEWALRFKHMPVLRSPDGVLVELHGRLWDEADAPPPPDGLFARAVADRRHVALRALSPADLLMHMAVHTIWAHRWDNGPLALIDWALCLEKLEFDWPRIRERSEREGWARPLALMLAATRRWLRADVAMAGPVDVPRALVEAAGPAMVAPASARETDRSARRLTRTRTRPARSVVTRLRRLGHPVAAARWLTEQASGWWRTRRDPAASARLRDNRRLEEWLAR